MPGQCYGCGGQFGVFKKEHGCKNCGFSFCTKCLHDKSIPVPKRNNAKHHVCVKCYKILSGQDQPSNSDQYELPKAYLKRVAALNEKGAERAQAKTQPTSLPQKLPANLLKLDKADREIALRLERLKESDKPKEKVLDTDLKSRLANLKGQAHSSEKTPAYQAPERRTQVEQIDDLLDEIAAEVEIDSHAPDPVKDIEARLAHYRCGEDGAGPPSEQDKRGPESANISKFSSISKPSGGPSDPAASLSDNGNEVNMEEMQRLMEATAKELEMDAHRALEGMHKDKELMERLAEIQKRKATKKADNDQEQSEEDASDKLVARNFKVDTDDDSDHSSESEDASARKLIQQYLEEAKIDEKLGDCQSPPEEGSNKKQKKDKKTKADGETSVTSDYDDSDELPYCCICNEDAAIRCKDCGLDLYCQRCFRECHKEVGLTDHETSLYKAPKGY